MDVPLVSVVCCQIEASAWGRSIVQSPTGCGVSECGREDSIMRIPRPTGLLRHGGGWGGGGGEDSCPILNVHTCMSTVEQSWVLSPYDKYPHTQIRTLATT